MAVQSYEESEDEDVVQPGRRNARGRFQKRRRTGNLSSDEECFKPDVDDDEDNYIDGMATAPLSISFND